MRRSFFLSVFCIWIIFLWSAPLKGFVRFYTYIKNDTPYVLLTQDNIQVLPHSTNILTSHQLDEPGSYVDEEGVEYYSPFYYFSESVNVEASIRTREDVGILPCSLVFETYNQIRIKRASFRTFVFVTEKDKKLICIPQAVEVQGNDSIKPGGKIYALKEAITLEDQRRRHEPCCLFYPYRPVPPVYIFPFNHSSTVP